jgi:hypothetical protein
VTDTPDRLIISNLNYVVFKLWQLSLLWRCAVSRLPEFKATRLGPHAEKIRMLLLDERAGQPHEYGCNVVLPSSHALLRRALYPPEPITIDGHRCYRAAFGGLWWVFVASSHSQRFPFQEGFLHEFPRQSSPERENSQQQIPVRSGVISIFKETAHSSNFILKLVSELDNSGRC